LTAGDVTGSPLWPLQVGDQFVFEKYDSLSNQWNFTQQMSVRTPLKVISTSRLLKQTRIMTDV